MTRTRLPLVLHALAFACFAVLLASILGDDFDVLESAWLAAGLVFTSAGFVAERLP